MEIIVGTIILKNNKVLMVREAKKECYGKWAFPAGHLEKNETIFDCALRETYEETGCEVKLKKVFPILVSDDKTRNIMMIHFLSDLIKCKSDYATDEILETKWYDLYELKNEKKENLRNDAVVKAILENINKDKFYDLNIFTDISNI